MCSHAHGTCWEGRSEPGASARAGAAAGAGVAAAAAGAPPSSVCSNVAGTRRALMSDSRSIGAGGFGGAAACSAGGTRAGAPVTTTVQRGVILRHTERVDDSNVATRTSSF